MSTCSRNQNITRPRSEAETQVKFSFNRGNPLLLLSFRFGGGSIAVA